jgi:hypothetical protein
MVLTYSSQPKLLVLEHLDKTPYTLRESYNEIMKYCGYTTDLMIAFDLLLDVAKRNDINDVDLAAMAIFSDMGFDQQFNSYGYYGYSSNQIHKSWNTTQENIELKYRRSGYTTPQIYYANLASTTHIQATKEYKGVSQFNTYSSSLFKYIMTGNLVLSTKKIGKLNESNDNEELQKKSTEDDFLGMINQTVYDRIRNIFTNEFEVLTSSIEEDIEEDIEKTEHIVEQENNNYQGYEVL